MFLDYDACLHMCDNKMFLFSKRVSKSNEGFTISLKHFSVFNGTMQVNKFNLDFL